MKRSNSLFVLVSIFSLLMLMTPDLVYASWYADLYLGGAVTEDNDLTERSRSGGVSTTTKTKDENFDSSFTAGGRFGHWFDSDPWLGFALDASYFKPDAGDLDITVVPLSVLLMLRYPGERLQPYAGIGPGIFFMDADGDLNDAGINDFSDKKVDTGLDARLGLKVKFKTHFAVFGEYRFTYVRTEFKDNISGANVDVNTDITTHHFLVGMSYSF